MLNKREKEILELIINKNYTLDEMVLNFKVSKRAIQYNINNINYYLSRNNYSKISIKNSKFITESKEQLKNFLNIINESLDIVKEDRIYLIYLYSIFGKNGLNISTLCKKINISRNTLKSEMKSLNENFIFNYSKGYKLEIDNNKKIEILEKIYKKHSLIKYTKEVLNEELLDKIEKFLQEISLNIKLNMTEEVYKKLLLSIYCYISFPEKNSYKWNDFNLGSDYKLVEKIFLKYFDKNENISVITDMIVGLSLNNKIENWLDESFLIKKMIKKVSFDVGIDLSEDKILYDFLFSHIKVSIYRLKKGIELNNPIYQKLIWEKDGIVDIVKSAVCEMEEIFEIKFTDVEIYLISYHFKASIDRMQTYNKKKVILVCGLGYGTSRLLEYSLKENFDIDIVDVLPAYMINNEILKNKNIDYILTTVDLEIDSIKISPNLKIEDYEKLSKLGIKTKKEKILVENFLDNLCEISPINKDKVKSMLLEKYPNIFVTYSKKKSQLLSMLSKEKVVFRKKCGNWEESIKILGEILEKNNSVTSKYTLEMIEMVKKLGSYIIIDDGIALPHAKGEKSVKKADISILILEDYVEFNNNKRAKIFFAFSTKDESSHLEILNDIYKLVMNKNFLENISKIKDYETFYKYIEKNI